MFRHVAQRLFEGRQGRRRNEREEFGVDVEIGHLLVHELTVLEMTATDDDLGADDDLLDDDIEDDLNDDKVIKKLKTNLQTAKDDDTSVKDLG